MLKLAQNTSASICCAHSSSPFSRWCKRFKFASNLTTEHHVKPSTQYLKSSRAMFECTLPNEK